MAGPSREFRRHFIQRTETDLSEEGVALTDRMAAIYHDRSKRLRKPSSGFLKFSMTNVLQEKVTQAGGDMAKPLNEVPEASSD
mmetsp:Transcript_23623/g.31670  ORF Transcript_23623/g.31670 Transcript_23623/m.31670 type:complete len:83 (+) Transcript_23623:2240-2488(+)|eukprot:CAMPEP_0185621840 /NCGR_PEP_ID=MMETSP0436-20130131/58717_1 /TAXON_ID=626734 ORGANISM="Favella taraikaensis, Strain Fe Narragansett Bay" /NCGR_SAMPLE_ID=MMETSP0436 /ASSEMBLY_ACC=CAM_ASM_000390 /LENGTH=82 /DNA_ID=CAMNT_0028263453 /DNA_START=812 /DNA_END=1060 /DNA_ORIENTATION=+